MCEDTLEDKAAKELYQNRIMYSLPTRIGFWTNDLAVQEDASFIISYKKNHCQLITQKLRKMFRNLLRTTVLAHDAPFVTYGENYQIRAADIESNLGDDSSRGYFVSGLVSEKEIDMCQHFRHGCILTASTCSTPCVRNTFKFVGANQAKDGMQLAFGDDFYIEISESDGPPLYLMCQNVNTDSVGNTLPISFTDTPNIYSRFKCYHWNPANRYQTLGSTVTPASRVVIQHTASGRNIVLKPNRLIPTFFGPECLLACDTLKDSHNMETAENFWRIICAKAMSKSDII